MIYVFTALTSISNEIKTISNMKKLIILTSFIFCSYIGSSQEIGVRFGDVLGNTVALDAVFSSGEFHRIHTDLSFGNDFGLEVLWDFVYRPFGGEAFFYYIGIGPSFLFSDDLLFGISGEIGLEYHFNGVPIAVGADWRPTYFLVEDANFEPGGFGFNARFVF
jgi:hypothetical protein